MALQNGGHGHKFNQFKKRKRPKRLELKIETKKCKILADFASSFSYCGSKLALLFLEW